MKQLEPDLWRTSARVVDDTVGTHAYLLTRPSGNLLIYGMGEGQGDDLDAMEALAELRCRCSAIGMSWGPR